MKSGKLLTALTAIAVTVCVQCMAQPEPARLSPPGAEGAARPGRPLQQVAVFTGPAGEWVTNDDYVYDGFYLQTAQGKSLVKFPPHMGVQLTKAVKTGSPVTVHGVEETTPGGNKEIRMVSIAAGGQTYMDTPPAAPPVPVEDIQLNGSGKVTAFQRNRENEINGYIIDGKTILRVPPHVITQLNTLITNGAAVSFTGMKKAMHDGEASNGNYNIVHCQTITVNGTQYLTR